MSSGTSAKQACPARITRADSRPRHTAPAIVAAWCIVIFVLITLNVSYAVCAGENTGAHNGSRSPTTTQPATQPDTQPDTQPATQPAQTEQPAWTELDEPVIVTFRLADGKRVHGKVKRWGAAGIDGTFGRRAWRELRLKDVWHVHTRLMDESAASAWVDLGGALIMIRDLPAVNGEAEQGDRTSRDGRKLAERAFHRALQIDPSVNDAIENWRQRRAEADRRAHEKAAAEAANRLRTDNPEARDWPASPWPALSRAQRKNALLSVRADALRIMDRLGVDWPHVESQHFIIHSDLSQRDATRWAARLDALHNETSKLLRRSTRTNIPWGKIVVFVTSDRKQFRQLEAEAFNQHVTPNDNAFTHYQGPKVFVSCFYQSNHFEFGKSLLKHAALGLLHRMHAPRRLPAWANEGLALYLAQKAWVDAPIEETLRPRAVQFIRSGGNVVRAMQLDYDSEHWPGPKNIGPAVGYLAITTMIDNRPDGFLAWFYAVKSGKDWVDAMKKNYSTPAGRFVQTMIRYYQVND